MFAKAAERLADALEESEIIKHDDRELYTYGFNQGMTILLNVVTTLVVGLVFHCAVQLVMYMVMYIPLRSNAGGYHAKTPLRCYAYSIVMLSVISQLIRYTADMLWLYVIICVVSSIVVLLLSPVEDKNKPLDELEVSVYRKRSVVILVIELAVWALLVLCIRRYEHIIPLALLTESVMLLAGYVKNKHISA